MNLGVSLALGSALRSAGVPSYSPLSLFGGGEQGVWYDPSDFSTMYQESTGITPVTAVGQPVGFLGDKSQGFALGAEVRSAGAVGLVGSATAATYNTTTGVGTAVRVDPANQSYVSWSGLTTNSWYAIVIQNTGAVPVAIRRGPSATSPSIGLVNAGQSVTFIADTAGVSALTIMCATGGAGSASFTVSSFRELPGNHATQPTAASRPILGRVPVGGRRNLLTYTEQFDNAAWTKSNLTASADSTTAPDGTLTADTITLTGATAGARQLASSSALARSYSFYVKNNSGARYFQILTDGITNAFANFDIQAEVVGSRGSSASASSITSVGDGWYRIQMTVTNASATNIYIGLVGSNTAGWSSGASSGSFFVWGAQLEVGSTATAYQRVTDQWNVTEAGVTPCYYLSFDGTDDGLQSAATINPGAVDKAQVFAGVRKLANLTGVIVESSPTTSSNNGSFLLQGPRANNDNYAFQSAGTTAAAAISSTNSFIAPITNVLTGIGDIAADTAILRIDGVQAATSAANQGTGDYLAYPLYIGRRGGTTLPFNGQLYSLIVRFGANLSAGIITQTENYVNSKTGAY